MNLFLYLMDGVSGVEAANYLDKIDDALEKGCNVNFKLMYGFDCTLFSYSALLSGKNPSSFNVINFSDSKHFSCDFNIISAFKEAGYRTHFITNNYKLNKFMFLEQYDNVSFQKELYPLNKIEFGNHSENNLIFIHDMYTHDQAGLYSKGKFEYSYGEYRALVKKHFTKILPETLANFDFCRERDDLIILSDHGMTIGNLDKSNDKDAWCLPSLDFKAKTFCRCYYADTTEAFEIDKPSSMLSIHNLLKRRYLNNDADIEGQPDDVFPHLGNNAFRTWNQNKLNQFYMFEKLDDNKYYKNIVQLNPFRLTRTKIACGEESSLETVSVNADDLSGKLSEVYSSLLSLDQRSFLANLQADYLNLGKVRHYLFILPKSRFSTFLKKIRR